MQRERRATSQDIAREAGVSQATVSRVLNGDTRVAPATRERVLAVVKRLHYTPNAIARGLVTSRTGLVGIVVSDVTNPFYPQLLESIAQRLSERGLKMVLYNAGGQSEEVYLRLLLEQRVDGIVFTAAVRDSLMVRELAEREFPLVLTNRHTANVQCDMAIGDNARGAEAVAHHLVGLGHRRIAVVAGDANASTSHDRLEGFAQALPAAGVELPEEYVRTARFDVDQAYRETLALLELPQPPTAIFCLNDLMAFGALNALRSKGLSVPGEVSVVGFDDIPMAGWESFQLTTVHQPLAEMARSSVDLLADRLDDPDRSVRKLVFPCTLVARATTGPASTTNGRSAGPPLPDAVR